MPLHPQLAAMAEAQKANPDVKPIQEQTPDEARAGYRALAAAFGPGPKVASIENRMLPSAAGGIPVRIYKPRGQGPFAVLVFYHGGGWVIGDLETHDRECRTICNGAGCAVVSVNYRLAPEHVFPAAVDDCFAALQWVAANGAEIGVDASRIAVGGDSAGGNLAAVMAILARDAGGPALRFQLLVYPSVDASDNDRYLSRKQNENGPFLELATMQWFEEQYLPDPATRKDQRASPLLAASHADLPPALVVTAEFDPLRDEGEAYARRLEQDRVPVVLHRYDRMPHIFFQLSGVVEEAKQLLDEASDALRSALA